MCLLSWRFLFFRRFSDTSSFALAVALAFAAAFAFGISTHLSFGSKIVILLSDFVGHPRQRIHVVVMDFPHFIKFESMPSSNRFCNTAWGTIFADLLDVVQVSFESFTCFLESVRAKTVKGVTVP